MLSVAPGWVGSRGLRQRPHAVHKPALPHYPRLFLTSPGVFSGSFLDPHCSFLSPDLDGKLSTLSLIGLSRFELREQGLGCLPSLPRRASVLLWKTESPAPGTSYSDSSRGIFAGVEGGGFIPWLQTNGFLSSRRLPIRRDLR